MRSLFWVTFLLLVGASSAHGWGNRGHATVAEAAAYLLADQYPLFKSQAFQLAYYNNVPDLLWKGTEKLRKQESSEHFMDLEVFERAGVRDWDEDRLQFLKKHKVPQNAGRALWRILELEQELKILVSQFGKAKGESKVKGVQGDWFKVAGILGHYVADLSQPLHVTENYDGQMTGQKGIHEFFETTLVNEAYPEILPLVHAKAREAWSSKAAQLRTQSTRDLIVALMVDSKSHVPSVLKRDRENQRDMARSLRAEKDLIVERLAVGGLYLALLWERNRLPHLITSGFYEFRAEPSYIKPREVKK